MIALTEEHRLGYHSVMIETVSFILGLGFSILVYFRTIRPADLAPAEKAFYFLISLIGIAGTLFLIGVMITFALERFVLVLRFAFTVTYAGT